MTIKLSKTQRESIGKQANWTKKAQLVTPAGGPQPATQNQIGIQPQQQQPQQPQQVPQTPILSGLQNYISRISNEIGNGGKLQQEARSLASIPQLAHSVTSLQGQPPRYHKNIAISPGVKNI